MPEMSNRDSRCAYGVVRDESMFPSRSSSYFRIEGKGSIIQIGEQLRMHNVQGTMGFAFLDDAGDADLAGT